jgi:hypothetical protein
MSTGCIAYAVRENILAEVVRLAAFPAGGVQASPCGPPFRRAPTGWAFGQRLAFAGGIPDALSGCAVIELATSEMRREGFRFSMVREQSPKFAHGQQTTTLMVRGLFSPVSDAHLHQPVEDLPNRRSLGEANRL